MDNMSGNMGCDNRKDNEIINAWKKILSTGDAPIGEHWSVGGVVTTRLAKDTYDTLTRQKAEIEQYKKNAKFIEGKCDSILKKCDTLKFDINIVVSKAKSEAIKEFAVELLDEKFSNYDKTDEILVYDIRDRIYEFAESYINRTVGDSE